VVGLDHDAGTSYRRAVWRRQQRYQRWLASACAVWLQQQRSSWFVSCRRRRRGTQVTPISSPDLYSYPLTQVSYLSISHLTLILTHLVEYHYFSATRSFRSRGLWQIESMDQTSAAEVGAKLNYNISLMGGWYA
jgi:hypothetical protein